MRGVGIVALLLTALAVLGCDDKKAASIPAPREVSDEAIGHYCGMSLPEHAGPKGQIFLASREDPVWFASVHDTVAFIMLPEEPKDIVAIYVNDMGKATSWDHPEPGTWILAKDAWYVIGSGRKGGMGGDELIPFGSEAAAQAFVGKEGGRIVRFDQIPREYVLTDGPAPARGHQGADQGDYATPPDQGSDGQAAHGHK